MSHKMIMALLLGLQLVLPAQVKANDQINLEKPGGATAVTAAVLPTMVNKTFETDQNETKTASTSSLPGDNLTTDGFVRVSNHNMADIIVFTQPKQVFSGRIYGMDWQATASCGTIISHKPAGLILHTGHLLAVGGKSPMKIMSNDLEITIPINSSCLVDAKDGKVTDIVALTSNSDSNSITVKSNKLTNNQIQLLPGQHTSLIPMAEISSANLENIMNGDVIFADVIAKAKSKDLISRVKADIAHNSTKTAPTPAVASISK